MKTNSPLRLLEYSLGSRVRAFSTTRHGGVGTGCYGGFNITHYCGDDIENVRRNKEILCAELNIPERHLFLPRQIHEDRCLCIDASFLELPFHEQSKQLDGIDALITNVRGICIGVSTADCIPVLLHVPEFNVIAAIHAGWRGTVKKIVCKTISVMTETYDISPQNIKAIIGPGISASAFEVGSEVYDKFCEAGFPLPQIARQYPATSKESKWHIDLWAANYLLLEECGLDAANIQVCGICTYACCNDFFSARRLGTASGRIFNGIMLS